MDTMIPTRSPAPAPARRRAARSIAAALLAVSLVLAACGGGDDETFDTGGVSSMPMPAPGFAPDAATMEPGLAFEERSADGNVAAGVGDDRATVGRAIVRTASIELVVEDGATAVDAIVARTADFDGQVASTTLSRSEDGTVSGSLVLRVPEARLDEFVEELDELARSVPFRTVDELDVTLELSDLDAQLENLRAFEDELRALLTEVRERDGTVEGLVAVSDRLRQIRTEIDLIEGRRIQLADRVALSTVYVTVTQARSATPVAGTWDLPGVVRDALAATVRLGQLAVEGIVWFALTMLPALAVVAVVVVAVRALRRRRRTSQ